MIWMIRTTLTIWILAVVEPTLNHKASRASTRPVEV
jgi:hypothetical protein